MFCKYGVKNPYKYSFYKQYKNKLPSLIKFGK